MTGVRPADLVGRRSAFVIPTIIKRFEKRFENDSKQKRFETVDMELSLWQYTRNLWRPSTAIFRGLGCQLFS